MSDLRHVLQPKDIQQISDDVRSNSIHHGPFYLEIHVTDRCNADCYFCNQRWLKSNSRELGLADFERILSRLIAGGLRAVRLSGGGEPTVHPRIADILDTVCKSGLVLARFDTNGIRLTPEISRRLIACRLQSLHISLQASMPESWAQMTRGRAADFQTVLQNTRRFLEIDQERKTYVYASFGIDEPTFNEVESMIRLCESLGIKFGIHDLNAHTYSERFYTICLPSLKDQLAAVVSPENQFCFRFSKLRDLKCLVENSILSPGHAPSGGAGPACLAPWAGILIRANGDVHLCCALSEKRHVLGNAFRQDLLELWQGSLLGRVRQEARSLYFSKPGETPEKPGAGDEPYLSQHYCRDCPVKRGMFSAPAVDEMIRGASPIHAVSRSAV